MHKHLSAEERDGEPFHNCPDCGRPAGYGPAPAKVYHMTCVERAMKHVRERLKEHRDR